MTGSDRHTIRAAGGVSASIKAQGAELCSLRTAAGEEVLWQAGPAWPKHAPVLFPIVGRLADDRLRQAGQDYRLSKHGFARDRRFRWLSREDAACALVLEDDAETRAVFPFAFRLEIHWQVSGDTLSTRYHIANPGAVPLFCALGAHPAFRWPLRDGVAKTDHSITFGADEPGALRRVQPDGLIGPTPKPSPLRGRVLALDPALFADDALVWDPVASRSLRYSAPGCPVVEMSWEGFPQLGIWSKPADFVCLEPWHGTADPAGFTGAFRDKPGLMRIEPGAGRDLSIRVQAA
ncbi:aldose 1-epimerase family protein [Oleisolibacter albus]|uniref:aldose 1-epimerase family protein n=1 Tax=Oleisolibacter albus TaxID=2171757 RepID=UPI000DF32E71|nr:aldose 1-epimerase family protein [Oleisolibacter albus]